MTIRVAIRHNTLYKFDRPVNLAPHVIRLRPAPHARSNVVSYSLKVQPEEHFINWQQDAFANWQARLVFPEKSRQLRVDVEVIADMTVVNPFDFFVEEDAEKYPFKYNEQTRRELSPYLEIDEEGERLRKWVAPFAKKKDVPINDFLVAVNQQLEKDIGYNIRMEPGVQSCEETLEIARGSCRDTSWLLVQIFRHLGIAARFVSGYLVQLASDQKALDGPSGPEQDFTDLHAWCEVYLPGAGWVGLDPTSGLFASEGHIPLACTPQPGSAAPISGAIDECEVELEFSNTVERVREDPRVTKPYTQDQWQMINALGEKVEDILQTEDVRLTQGGEPTFVSIDDMDGAQWNTEALGAEKLKLAKELLTRLRKRFGPDGVVHYGQGKWYPGEELPRWALGTFWRTDNEALWSDHSLLADVDKEYGHNVESAEQFAAKLCDALNIQASSAQPAWEDATHYLLQEQSLPEGIDPLKANLKDDLERRRLARLLDKGLNTVTGLVIPLQYDDYQQAWQSSLWKMRRDRIVLIPGDSPMGLRLPLDSIAAAKTGDKNAPRYPDGADPFESKQPLAAKAKDNREQKARAAQKQLDQADYPIRTSLCIEPRNGRLHVFMPPMPTLEQWTLLVGALEQAAKASNIPIVMEGYEPPRDARLQRLLVTPDPGVIEVNVQPANNWAELRDNTFALYEEARQTRLGTEKFMLDGRHGGTGGGNHVTLGGAQPVDSPLLRRPDLLRSLVCYWQHHPSLSYLFSGMFIGPTSQAPRVDEGRDTALYELAIAFEQADALGEQVQPWIVDRLFRNLLVDITGNTHRSEFCIDKLYAPGSTTGRLGILEFRGFEMPPHPQMALVQALLIRALVAKFWREPYRKQPVHWQTQLHDKFMLPHYVWSDMKDVVQDLTEAGIPFDLEWLTPFEEFRFPHYGRLNIDDIELELRWAIEPWNVLGEEVGSFGTARYVDSSVERVQVKVSGLTPGRHVLSCNGRRVPPRNTGTKGEFVAGVRYKAWAPPSALHPTIGVHAPLVFDVIDSWNGRSIGGCTYHVSHPGGRSYDALPVNAAEAESRRVNRFHTQGHTPGHIAPPPSWQALRKFVPHDQQPRPMAPPAEEPTGDFPNTLDLRSRAV